MSKTSLKVRHESTGQLIIIKPSDLAEKGATGVIASGTYEGMRTNLYKGKQLTSFELRQPNGDLVSINGTKALAEQFSQLDGARGTNVEVVYNGKIPTKAGNDYHDFEVFVING